MVRLHRILAWHEQKTDLSACRRKIPDDERIAYRRAVECLMKKPALYAKVDGAKSVTR
jgi:hypothetical protein